MKRRIRLHGELIAVVVAGLAAVLMLAISTTSHWRVNEARAELASIDEARIRVQQLLLAVTDAETAQRGFLLTGRKEYGDPYHAALMSLPGTRAWLRDHYAGRAELEQTLTRLDELVEEKLSELALLMKLYESGRADDAREMLLTNIGKEHMDALRSTAHALLDDEARGGELMRKRVDQILMLDRIGVALMTALSLAALLMYLRSTRTLEAERARQQAAIQAERDQLEAQVARRTDELTVLSRDLMTAREDERARLARELHDELGALLTAAKLDVARIKPRIAALSPEMGERLRHLSEMLDSGISLKRRVIEDLRPSSLSNLGLIAALRILIEDFEKRTELAVRSDLQPVPLRPECELTVYRLVQEALTNVAKYAKARNVYIVLGARDGLAVIEVSDDGVGFDPAHTKMAGNGLLGMRYRVEAECGALRVKSAPGEGTNLKETLPLLTRATAI